MIVAGFLQCNRRKDLTDHWITRIATLLFTVFERADAALMLAIITALRSRLLAKEWDYHVWLLQRTLDSILAQTNDAFVIAVVCHEKPRIPQAGHHRVHFLSVEFDPPQRNNDDMCVDKVLKL